MAMSDTNESSAIGGGPEVDGQPKSDWESINPPLDHFLQSLVGLANDGIEMGVTLTVGGS
jgi:hypothetical protein